MTTINSINSNIPIEVSKGGTGDTTLAAHGVLIGNGTSGISVTAVGNTGQILTGSTGADPVWASPAASSITITGDSGGALSGAAFTFTGGTTGLTFSGASTTETLTGTLVVANGGTGVATMTTAYAPVCAGTTATGALQVASTGLSTSGNVLTSNGSSALPSFQAVSAGGGLLSATLVMNSAQFKASNTPVVIVAAQGAGTFLQLVSWTCKLFYGGSNAFTGSGAGGIWIGTGAVIQIATVYGTSGATYTASAYTYGTVTGNTSITAATAAACENQALTFVGAGGYAGNAAANNTVTVNIVYKVLSI